MIKLKTFLSISRYMLLSCLLVACKGNASTEENSADLIEFETLEGVIKKPVTFAEASYDSVTVEYRIAWPVKGSEEVVGYVKKWILDRLTEDSHVKTVNSDISEVLGMIADDMNAEDAPHTKSITVWTGQNIPFDSYLDIRYLEESHRWLANYFDYKDENLIIRLTDGKVFQPDIAINDEALMRRIIGKNLKIQYEEADPNWVWSEEIQFCNEYNIPMPITPISLAKDGVCVSYMPGEISPTFAGGFSCVVPYTEVKPLLSESALEFLYGNDTKEKSKRTLAIDANERTPFSMDLAGKVDGKYAVEMHIKGYRTSEGIFPESGKYCYTKYKAWIDMDFEIEKANDFKIYAYTDGKLTGTWDVYFDNDENSIIGYLTNYKGVTYPVELKVVDE